MTASTPRSSPRSLTWSDGYRSARSWRQTSLLASMLTRTVRDRRRWTGTSASLTAVPSSWRRTGSSSPAGSPSSSRRDRSRSQSADGGRSARVSAASSVGRSPAATNGRTTRSWAAKRRLAQEGSAKLVELALGKAVERGDEPGSCRHAVVDLVGGEVVLERDVHRLDAVDPDDRIVGVRRPSGTRSSARRSTWAAAAGCGRCRSSSSHTPSRTRAPRSRCRARGPEPLPAPRGCPTIDHVGANAPGSPSGIFRSAGTSMS